MGPPVVLISQLELSLMIVRPGSSNPYSMSLRVLVEKFMRFSTSGSLDCRLRRVHIPNVIYPLASYFLGYMLVIILSLLVAVLAWLYFRLRNTCIEEICPLSLIRDSNHRLFTHSGMSRIWWI